MKKIRFPLYLVSSVLVIYTILLQFGSTIGLVNADFWYFSNPCHLDGISRAERRDTFWVIIQRKTL